MLYRSVSDAAICDSSAAAGTLLSAEPSSGGADGSVLQDVSSAAEMNVTSDDAVVSMSAPAPSTSFVSSTYTQLTVGSASLLANVTDVVGWLVGWSQ